MWKKDWMSTTVHITVKDLWAMSAFNCCGYQLIALGLEAIAALRLEDFFHLRLGRDHDKEKSGQYLPAAHLQRATCGSATVGGGSVRLYRCDLMTSS